MATAINSRDIALQATSPRIVPISLPSNVSIDFTGVTGTTKPANNATKNVISRQATAPTSPTDGDIWVDTSLNPNVVKTRISGVWQSSASFTTDTTQLTDGANLGGTATWTGVTGAGKPANNADVTTTILGASGTSIVMTNANLFKSSSGLGGVFVGSAGLFGKDTSGNTTFSIDGSTGAATFKGNISGGANIDITGNALFKGAGTSSGFTYAGIFNSTGAADGGVRSFGTATGAAVSGDNLGGGRGVWAKSSSGVGLYAEGNTAVHAVSTGVALKCDGPMEKSGTDLVANLNAELWGSMKVTGNTTGSATATFSASSKPGSNSTNTWLVINAAGINYYIPIWA